MSRRLSFVRATGAAGFAALLAAALPGVAFAQSAANQEIIITITRVKALEKIDKYSQADFMARVTIAGDTISTKQVKQADDIRPNWVIAKRVTPGVHNVKLEILDKDLTKSEAIDVNRLDKKRDLDFTVDTRSCRVEGFSSTYKCGSAIVRGGRENKAAAVSFKVEVKKI